jgi:hypothetical protein
MRERLDAQQSELIRLRPRFELRVPSGIDRRRRRRKRLPVRESGVEEQGEMPSIVPAEKMMSPGTEVTDLGER